MTTAADLDPYVLPWPTPDSPVVLPHRVVAQHAHQPARYAEPDWPLAALTENPSSTRHVIQWASCPAIFREELRMIAWGLINGELRPSFLKVRGTRMRGRIGPELLKDTVLRWFHLASWLENREIATLTDCGSDVLHEYGLHLRDKAASRDSGHDTLVALTRLWGYDQLAARPVGVGCPPWEMTGIDDYLPSETSTGGENKIEPLAEATMGPLLVWAMRMVDDLADDILAGSAEAQRLNTIAATARATAAGKARLQSFLEPSVSSGAPLPAVPYSGGWAWPATTSVGSRVARSPRSTGSSDATDWLRRRDSGRGLVP
ncbi:hypothetical protein ACU4GG_29175 [Streptomyces nojiriensis]